MAALRSLAADLRIRVRPTPSRSCICVRNYTVKSSLEVSQTGDARKVKLDDNVALSSCPENTVLTGLNYLKDQPPVLAKPDNEYPTWLWDLLKPKVHADTGPGSKGEKAVLRQANRQRIKEQNFMKTQ